MVCLMGQVGWTVVTGRAVSRAGCFYIGVFRGDYLNRWTLGKADRPVVIQPHGISRRLYWNKRPTSAKQERIVLGTSVRT